MKQFALYDSQQPLAQQQLLKKYERPQNKYDVYFVKEDDHLLVYEKTLHTFPLTSSRHPGETELIEDQFEMPLSGIRWFINAIEQKFFKSPEDGGLPADKISYKETVDGEGLHIIRAMTAGCEYPGYVITNSSRYSYIDSSDMQTLALSDPWLFKNGLMDFLKEVATKYESGEL